jgi:hypothetical protein
MNVNHAIIAEPRKDSRILNRKLLNLKEESVVCVDTPNL